MNEDRSIPETEKGEIHPGKKGETTDPLTTQDTRIILFTGHMIDKENRSEPRFPPCMEDAARAAIQKAVQEVTESAAGPIRGIAGGACGGDILFHEVCADCSVLTDIYLALPPVEFLEESVTFAGPQWVKRFNQLLKVQPVKVLDTKGRMALEGEQTIWVQCNLWMLRHATGNGGEHLTVIALWDGKGGDGVGGTEHMVQVAKEKGAAIIWINTKELFGLNG